MDDMNLISANQDDVLDRARAAVTRGEVICLPTDTVYGIGADPTSPEAITRLLTAKGRTRAMPPPVLVASVDQAMALASQFPRNAGDFIEKYWPGALTLIFPANPSLGWDLGETNGTVAIRMPNHPVALDLLHATGPLAVTSANMTGQPPATSAQEAQAQLGEAIGLYIDDGPSKGGLPSTIVRFSDDGIELLREGAISREELAMIASINPVK